MTPVRNRRWGRVHAEEREECSGLFRRKVEDEGRAQAHDLMPL